MQVNGTKRLWIVSFDFKQPKGSNQARKTRFFRELYGYTQQVKQLLKGGKEVTRTYHYSGIMDQLPFVKLGKSVLGVQPGTEGPILELLHKFDEVDYYNFIGWVPSAIWTVAEDNNILMASKLITMLGYLSVIFVLKKYGGITQVDELRKLGFDSDYINQALTNLEKSGLILQNQDVIQCTDTGETVATILVEKIKFSEI
ncbi:MAG: hypothetical protein ACFFAL_06135 [Promethearchaeota archaeon]